MIEQIINYIQVIIAKYGALGIFFATIIEEVVAPIPSPLVPLAGGFFLLPPTLSWGEALIMVIPLVAIPVAVGLTLGSTLVYFVGYFGGKPIIDHWGKWLGTNWTEIKKAEEKLAKRKGDELILFALRLLPLAPGVALSAFCGIIRYKFITFIVTTFLGSMVRASMLALIGWQVGEVYYTYAEALSNVEGYLFIGIVLCVILWGGLFWHKKRKVSI